jgi:hypothetical protein
MSSRSLEMPRRSEPSKRTRLWWVLTVIGIFFLAVGWAIWFLRTPDGLPTSSRTAEGNGVVGQDLYVGMWAVGDDFDRTIRITDIKVAVEAEGDVTVEPKLCTGGTVSITSDASSFCTGLTDAEGADFTDGDSIVLVVTASQPTTVTLGRLEVSYRDGIRWATRDAGLAGATLVFAEGDPGVADDTSGTDNAPSERPGQDDKPGKEKDKDKKTGKHGDKNAGA